MTDELGRFTSDRRVRDDASWATQDDWESGVAENIDVTAGGLVAQSSVQNSEMADRELYYNGRSDVGWTTGATRGAYELSKENDHLFMRTWEQNWTAGYVTWVTKTPIDVTNANILKVSWEIESEGIPNDEVSAKFALIEDQQDRIHPNVIDHEYYFVRGYVTDRTTEVLDIANAESSWYVGISLDVGRGGHRQTDPGVLRAYEVLLDG